MMSSIQSYKLFILLFLDFALEIDSSSYIFNGKHARGGQFPYQIYITVHYQEKNYQLLYNCGGALLNKKFGISAAHCVSPEVVGKSRAEYVEVLLGTHDLSKTTGERQIRNITKIFRHSKFNHETAENDIALIKFSHSVKFATHIQPVSLPFNQDLNDGQIVTLSGWGDTEKQNFPDILSFVHLQILNHSTCQKLLQTFANLDYLLTEHNVCAQGLTHPAGSCQGDSGGPLIIKDTSVLVGVTSFKGDASCKESKGPDVFTKVSEYLDWIRNVLSLKGKNSSENDYEKLLIKVINL